jgi:hypothetical protein
VHQHILVARRVQLALGQQALHKIDGAHLGDQRGVERDFVDPVHDVARRGRQLVALDGVDLHQHNVAAGAFIDQRVDGRVAGEAAVPVVHPIDLHRLEHRRQAGRGHHRTCGEPLAREDLRLARGHRRGHDKHLERLVGRQPLEVNGVLQKLLQRVDVQRIALVGGHRLGPQAGHGVAEYLTRRMGTPGQRAKAAKQNVQRRALGLRDAGCHGAHVYDPVPEVRQRGTRGLPHLQWGLPLGLGKTVRQGHGIHRAGAGSADAFQLHPAVLQQRVQHAPGERTMRATALQGQIDRCIHASRVPEPAIPARAALN